MFRVPVVRAARRTAAVVAGALGAGLGLTVGARATRWLGPLRVEATLALDPAGGTRVDLPPLGTALLRTHRGPLQVRARAVDVDPGRAEGLLQMPTTSRRPTRCAASCTAPWTPPPPTAGA